jgi:hypothetical protein
MSSFWLACRNSSSGQTCIRAERASFWARSFDADSPHAKRKKPRANPRGAAQRPCAIGEAGLRPRASGVSSRSSPREAFGAATVSSMPHRLIAGVLGLVVCACGGEAQSKGPSPEVPAGSGASPSGTSPMNLSRGGLPGVGGSAGGTVSSDTGGGAGTLPCVRLESEWRQAAFDVVQCDPSGAFDCSVRITDPCV